MKMLNPLFIGTIEFTLKIIIIYKIGVTTFGICNNQ